VVCHNPEPADRDALVRDRLLAYLGELMAGSDGWTERLRDEFLGSLKTKPASLPSPHQGGLLRLDAAAIKAESHLVGKWLLSTTDSTLSPEDLAVAYKQLLQVDVVGAT